MSAHDQCVLCKPSLCLAQDSLSIGASNSLCCHKGDFQVLIELAVAQQVQSGQEVWAQIGTLYMSNIGKQGSVVQLKSFIGGAHSIGASTYGVGSGQVDEWIVGWP